jgi:hypothetical protein
MTRCILAFAALAFIACAPALPTELAVDSRFTPEQVAVMQDAADQWCDATGGAWCPMLVSEHSVGASPIVAEFGDYAAIHGKRPDSLAFRRGSDGAIIVNMAALESAPLAHFWVVFAHEMAHLGTDGHVDHEGGSLMSQYVEMDRPLCIDARAAEWWCDERGESGCQSTCEEPPQ